MSDHGPVRRVVSTGPTAGRGAGFAAGVAALVVLLAAPAAAHVSVQPLEGQEARVGETVTVTVRVPNERSVGTERVALFFPEPIQEVAVVPSPGWTVTATTLSRETPVESLNRVSSVPIVPIHEGEDHTGGDEPLPEDPPAAGPETFTDVTDLAWEGGPLGADEVADFVVTLGPLPDVPTLMFKATQTYEDGEVVRWIEEPVDDETELAFPAPTLELVGATTEPSTTTAAEAVGEDGTSAADRSDGGGGSDWWRSVLIGVAIMLVVGGVTARVVAQRRIRRESARS